MEITESYENYLETVYILLQRNGEVHSVDVAHHLSFSKPSVSVAMKNLKQNGYIYIDAHGHITLSETGLAIAKEMYKRHQAISSLLMKMGVDEKTATDDACKIEHVISDKSFAALMAYVEKHREK